MTHNNGLFTAMRGKLGIYNDVDDAGRYSAKWTKKGPIGFHFCMEFMKQKGKKAN